MSESDLSLVSLRDYVETRFTAQRDYTDTRLHAIEQAVEHANASLNLRLEGMNEFRDALKDQTARFVTRTELEALGTDVRGLRESRAKLEGMATQGQVIVAWVMSVVGILLGAIGLILKLIGK